MAGITYFKIGAPTRIFLAPEMPLLFLLILKQFAGNLWRYFFWSFLRNDETGQLMGGVKAHDELKGGRCSFRFVVTGHLPIPENSYGLPVVVLRGAPPGVVCPSKVHPVWKANLRCQCWTSFGCRIVKPTNSLGVDKLLIRIFGVNLLSSERFNSKFDPDQDNYYCVNDYYPKG